MIQAMRAQWAQDEMKREVEEILARNRAVIESSGRTMERFDAVFREYQMAMGDLLREAGIELPGHGPTALRSRGLI